MFFVKTKGEEVENSTINRKIHIEIGWDEIGLFVQGGNVLPWQTPGNNTATR